MDITEQRPNEMVDAQESVSCQQGEDHNDELDGDEVDKKCPPMFATLYHTMGKNKFCTPSVEKKLRSTWARWAEYCKCSSFTGEPWTPLYGLQLYHNRVEIMNNRTMTINE